MTTLGHMVSGAGAEGFTPYGIAATLVLLPIAAVFDMLYSKHEPEKKTGAASIIMVIHAVIFALLGNGALIKVVFTAVPLLISDASGKDVASVIITALSLAIIHRTTFVRTLYPTKIPLIYRVYLFFMISITTITVILAIIGPIGYERITKNDKLTVNNLSTLSGDIVGYAKANAMLPETLNEIKPGADGAKMLIYYGEPNSQAYDNYVDDQSERGETSGNETYLVTSDHPSGNVYYKLGSTDCGY